MTSPIDFVTFRHKICGEIIEVLKYERRSKYNSLFWVFFEERTEANPTSISQQDSRL